MGLWGKGFVGGGGIACDGVEEFSEYLCGYSGLNGLQISRVDNGVTMTGVS